MQQQSGSARLAEELMRFVRLGARAKGMLSVHAGDLGAEFSALMLLFPLRFHGPMRVTDLAEIKQADPSTVSRQAAQLVKAGLARREADPEDGRASRLAVTEAGLAACARLHDAREALLADVLSDWPADRVDAFVGLFADFNNAVETRLRAPVAATPRENA
ncbi:MarR family winged helix-turn-helix transcriptional regulator [Paractinoplanes rishiriensis]|uniref:MarR family transcriptional regulator n=1 Tax=Paractinoplanes rishiriensis TaxID=1050105 RepID=A0A919K892_9ACTN|nr:MarR family transcriptional regulator [Actinoplanes rishiriensis]GIF00324.1 MarR family transcriptional regulator [Actinoplanes rishiriensis]